MSTIARDVPAPVIAADCEAEAPLCPRCGNLFVGLVTGRSEYNLVTCARRLQRDKWLTINASRRARGEAAAPRNCGQHAIHVVLPGRVVRVYAVPSELFTALLDADVPLRKALGRLGALTLPRPQS